MTIRQILRPISSDLDRVREEIEVQLSHISSVALSTFQSITDRSIHHLFAVHGKHLRPALVLLTARSFADRHAFDNKAMVKVACAVELVHSASLVHDDIIDTADIRRGRVSVNAEFGNKTAVLVGDLLYDQSFAVLTELRSIGPEAQLELFELITSTTRKMCLGEIYEDEIVERHHPVDFDDYLRVVDYKTASLMACCCRASAIVAGAASGERDLAHTFGFHLGRTYQLVDDLLDRDSVFTDREQIAGQVAEEYARCTDALRQMDESDAVSRLSGLTEAVLERAGDAVHTGAGSRSKGSETANR
jgi:geranylgeranyl pyrophosphate synthase